MYSPALATSTAFPSGNGPCYRAAASIPPCFRKHASDTRLESACACYGVFPATKTHTVYRPLTVVPFHMLDPIDSLDAQQVGKSSAVAFTSTASAAYNLFDTGDGTTCYLQPYDKPDTTFAFSVDGEVFMVGAGVAFDAPSGLYNPLNCHITTNPTARGGNGVLQCSSSDGNYTHVDVDEKGDWYVSDESEGAFEIVAVPAS